MIVLRKRLAIVLIPLLFFLACSTKKNTALTRSYHNMTSHYNIFFNGYESLKKGEKKIDKDVTDDYTRLIPVFPYSVEAASGASGDMDRTIKKSTKVAALHSITVKPEIKKGVVREKDKKFYNKKEFNKWIDDCYFLIGKSHFAKGDYILAIRTFRFILNEYPDESCITESKIWLARALVQTGELKEAMEILDALDPLKLQKILQSYYYAVYADELIHQKKYTEAVPKLELALKNVKLKKKKVRYSFIIAQLYELTGQTRLSYDWYSKVIKMNPVYEIAFNALINRAGVFEDGQDDKLIRQQLIKMLSDAKNKEYRDQIYYALGNIDIKQNKKEDAILNYKMSAQASVSNQKQKARSFLTLADIYYNDKNYLDASKYYDSTVAFMDKEDADYGKTQVKARVLGKLAKSINTVIFEDSVQRIAKMPEAERNKIIDEQIEKVKREEEEKKKKEMEEMLNQQNNLLLAQNMNMGGFGSSDPSGNVKWYFYNPSTRASGESEFKLRWGGRKLEDNWRRSNRRAQGDEVTESEEDKDKEAEDKLEAKKKKLSNKSREYYMINLPLSDSMMDASHEKIKNALDNAGEIYKEDLNEPKLATPQYEELIKRYPNDPVAVQACYTLYNMNKKLNNTVMSEHYRDMILSKYPESVYAKVLLDPNYIKELEAKEKEVSSFYEMQYQKYISGSYQDVISQCEFALEKWPKHILASKYAYLKAMCIAKMGNKPLLRTTLESVVKKYPKTEEAAIAGDIIAYLDKEHPEIEEEAKLIVVAEEQEQEIYSYSEDEAIHYVGVFIPKDANMSQLVFNLINYNLDSYTNLTFDVKGEELNKKYNMALIKSFKNKNDASKYYSAAMAKDDLFQDVKAVTHTFFMITETNLPILLKDGSEGRYLRFYKQHYK